MVRLVLKDSLDHVVRQDLLDQRENLEHLDSKGLEESQVQEARVELQAAKDQQASEENQEHLVSKVNKDLQAQVVLQAPVEHLDQEASLAKEVKMVLQDNLVSRTIDLHKREVNHSYLNLLIRNMP